MIQPKTLHYFDWNEVTNEVERLSGKNIRNWAGKSWNSDDPSYNNEYLDFWHKFLEMYEHQMHNGAYIEVDFEQELEYWTDTPWVVEILKLYQQVVSMPVATFHIRW